VRLNAARKAAVLLVPWGFLAFFATVYALVVLPRARDGQFIALCIGGLAALVFVSFLVAAMTFSRDVLLDRWPEPTAE
jgi:hypothetical protein